MELSIHTHTRVNLNKPNVNFPTQYNVNKEDAYLYTRITLHTYKKEYGGRSNMIFRLRIYDIIR